MGRPTQKQIKEQNQALLSDARSRVGIAENAVYGLKIQLAAAEAVEKEAKEALVQLERRLGQTQPQLP